MSLIAYKLTSETVQVTGEPTKTIAFQYDNVGNRLKRFDDGSPTPTQTFTYDANDRIATLNGVMFDYDANGNQLGDPIAGHVYSWDLEDRLLGVTGGGHTLANAYSGEGMRLQSIEDGITTQYVIDPNTEYYRVLEEMDATTRTVNVAYTYGDALLKQSIGPSFYHGDAIGSTRTLTSPTQAATDTYAYEAFGTTLATAGTTRNKYLFAAEELGTTGVYNLRARHYMTGSGRFLARDPVMVMGGTAPGHAYSYARNAPSMWTDPSGLETEDPLSAQVELAVCVLYKAFHAGDYVTCSYELGADLWHDSCFRAHYAASSWGSAS